jgi:hypothetical protein
VINLVPSVNWTEQILGNDLEMLQKCGGDWGKAFKARRGSLLVKKRRKWRRAAVVRF